MGMEIIDFKATKCKHCYKCVRYCDVKAIQVKDERASSCLTGAYCADIVSRYALSQPRPFGATWIW